MSRLNNTCFEPDPFEQLFEAVLQGETQVKESLIIERCYERYPFVCTFKPTAEDCLSFMNTDMRSYRYFLKNMTLVYDRLSDNVQMQEFVYMLVYSWVNRLMKWEKQVNMDMIFAFLKTRSLHVACDFDVCSHLYSYTLSMLYKMNNFKKGLNLLSKTQIDYNVSILLSLKQELSMQLQK